MGAGSPAASQSQDPAPHPPDHPSPHLHKCRHTSRVHVQLLFLCAEPGSHSRPESARTKKCTMFWCLRQVFHLVQLYVD